MSTAGIRPIVCVLWCLFLFILTGASNPRFELKRREHALTARQVAEDKQQAITDLANKAAEKLPNASSYTDAIKKVAKGVLDIPHLDSPTKHSWAKFKNGLTVDLNAAHPVQVPWFGNLSYSTTPDMPMREDGAWKFIHQEFEGFVMNKSLVVSDERVHDKPVLLPFFVSNPSTYDPAKIKRVILVFPGKPRDSWKYATLVYNVQKWVYQEVEDINPGEVLIISPLVLNQLDLEAGGVYKDENWVAFKESNWQSGGHNHFPKLKNPVSFYAMLDKMMDVLFDRQWLPNLNQVVVAGHSMGGQATVRYALLKERKPYDNNMKFWVGNPGSYPWLVNSTDKRRPNSHGKNPVNLEENCRDHIDTWPYGLGGDMDKIPKYARDRVKQNTSDIISNYRKRHVHYAFALLDNGAGDTNCAAKYQGYSHLQRGTYFVQMLANMSEGFPVNHSVSYAPRVSHQDYAMLAQPMAIDFIFKKDYNTRHPDISLFPEDSKTNNSESSNGSGDSEVNQEDSSGNDGSSGDEPNSKETNKSSSNSSSFSQTNQTNGNNSSSSMDNDKQQYKNRSVGVPMYQINNALLISVASLWGIVYVLRI